MGVCCLVLDSRRMRNSQPWSRAHQGSVDDEARCFYSIPLPGVTVEENIVPHASSLPNSEARGQSEGDFRSYHVCFLLLSGSITL